MSLSLLRAYSTSLQPVRAQMSRSSADSVTRPLVSAGDIDPAYSERDGGADAICGAKSSAVGIDVGLGVGCGVSGEGGTASWLAACGCAVGGVVNGTLP